MHVMEGGKIAETSNMSVLRQRIVLARMLQGRNGKRVGKERCEWIDNVKQLDMVCKSVVRCDGVDGVDGVAWKCLGVMQG